MRPSPAARKCLLAVACCNTCPPKEYGAGRWREPTRDARRMHQHVRAHEGASRPKRRIGSAGTTGRGQSEAGAIELQQAKDKLSAAKAALAERPAAGRGALGRTGALVRRACGSEIAERQRTQGR